MSILIFIISLAILILVHEFGHFIVAKKSGIRVDEFGLGFPPKIWGKKMGETEYTLNAIPFGGFVKIFQEDAPDESTSRLMTAEDKSRSFAFKPKWIQALVLVAGVSMNIIFAWLLLSLGFMIGLPASVDHTGIGTVKNPHVTVIDVLPNSPAEKAGLHSGDIILSVARSADSIEDPGLTPEKISDFISNFPRTGGEKSAVDITYERGNNLPRSVTVDPSGTIVSGKRLIGIAMDEVGTLQLPIHLALFEGARTTYDLTKNTVIGLGIFLGNIFTFHSDFSQVSGPVGIAGTVGQARELGFVYLLSLVALISINLAVLNLLPFPALDGGRLLFVIIEGVTRRKLPANFVRITNVVGFSLLLLLMLVVTGHDIWKLF